MERIEKIYEVFSELFIFLGQFLRGIDPGILYRAVPPEWWDRTSRENCKVSLLELALIAHVRGEGDDGSTWDFRGAVIKALDTGRVIPTRSRDKVLLALLFGEEGRRAIEKKLEGLLRQMQPEEEGGEK